jgi:hypothetical protein
MSVYSLLSLYLSPFRDLTWQDPVKLKRNRVVTISMLKDGVKFPNRDVDAVECIMEHLDVFLKEIRRITAAMMTPTTSTARRFEGILDMFTVTSWVAPKKRKKKGGLRAFLLWDILSYYNWQHLFTIPTDVK